MTKGEAVIKALAALLAAAIPTAIVKRDDALPATLPEGVMLLVPDGTVEPDGELLGVHGPWYLQHTIPVEVAVKRALGSDRDAAFDDALAAIDAALQADLTLGGAAEGMVWGRPASEADPFPGAAGVKTGTIEIVIDYQSPTRI